MTSFHTRTYGGNYSINIETDNYDKYLALQEACRSIIDQSGPGKIELGKFNSYRSAMNFIHRLTGILPGPNDIFTVAQYYVLLGKLPEEKHYDYGWRSADIYLSDYKCIYSSYSTDGSYVVDFGKPKPIELLTNKKGEQL